MKKIETKESKNRKLYLFVRLWSSQPCRTGRQRQRTKLLWLRQDLKMGGGPICTFLLLLFAPFENKQPDKNINCVLLNFIKLVKKNPLVILYLGSNNLYWATVDIFSIKKQNMFQLYVNLKIFTNFISLIQTNDIAMFQEGMITRQVIMSMKHQQLDYGVEQAFRIVPPPAFQGTGGLTQATVKQNMTVTTITDQSRDEKPR